jgi:hypothetical protein
VKFRPAVLSLLLLSSIALAPSARAEGGSPIQVALFNPAQIVKEDKSVKGVRIDLLYGKNADVTGLDWGLVNQTTGNEGALQIGFVNLVDKDFTGWQDGGFNITKGEFTGLQTGIYNSTEDMNGFAYGWVNRSRNMRGFQLGLVNITETMHGLQIGVANMIQKGKIPFLPIVNWSF